AEVSYRPLARNRRNHSAAWHYSKGIIESGQQGKSKKTGGTHLSNRASNLSGFAPLRETSAIQGTEKFFTLRREGAKEATESKHRISSRNLSGFAPLRETSPILWQR